MGLFGGLKKIGRGIGKGIKKGVKAVDKFDDWIKLKELAQIGQFIPGVNVFAKPLAMTYAGFDTAKNLKEGNLMKAALAGASMYGSHKIDTGGIGSWGELAEGVQGPTQSLRQAIQSNIGGNLKNYAGGFSNPLGLMDKYAGLDKGSKFAIDTLAPPILGSLQGGQEQSRGPSAAPYQSYQPIDYGNIAGFSPTTQLPTQAQGGITGDDWHRPINRLPANYEGWVTQPSLATLGEAGKEAVLPLNKLLPAMNKGGLNYSPGQAIVGEAGPEYVTRLGPGEEQYAQSILKEQPMPQMREGGVAGNAFSSVGRLGRLGMGGALKFLGMPLWALENLGLNIGNILKGEGNWLGEDIGGKFGSGALHGPGTPYPTQQDYLNSPEYELDVLGGRRDPLGEDHTEDPEGYRMAEEAYQEKARQVEAERRNTIGQASAVQNGQPVEISPGMSEAEMVGGMMRGESLPKKEFPPYVGPQGLDPALLDNYNAREWQRRAETSPEDKKRYEGMLQDLIQRQNEGEVFPTPTYSATALDKLATDGQEGPTRIPIPPWLEGGNELNARMDMQGVPPPLTNPRLDRYPSEEGANIIQQGPLSGMPATQQGPGDELTRLQQINRSRVSQGKEPLQQLPESQLPVDRQLERSWVDQEPFQVPVDTPSPFPPEWDAYRGLDQEPDIAPPPETQEETQYKSAEIAQMLIQRGMDPRSAAHMAANIMQESGGWVGKDPHKDPSLSGKGGTSGGAVSWRDPHLPGGGRDPGGRLARIENHYGKEIKNITMQEQIDYMMKEMQDEYWVEGDKRYKTGTWDVLMNPNATQDQRFGAMKNYLGWGTEGSQRNPAYHGAALQQFSGGRPFVPDFVDLKSDLAPNMAMAPDPKEEPEGPVDSFMRWLGY